MERRTSSEFAGIASEQRLECRAHQSSGAGAPQRLVSIKQAMSELGIGRTCLYDLIASKKLKTVKLNRRRLIPVEAIDALIAELLA